MICSRYNHTVDDGSHSLVFNARTGAVVVFDNKEYERFFKKQFTPVIQKQLFELGLYVNDSFDEFEAILERCRTRVTKSTIKKYRILTTTACNAKCPYCYEKGIPVKTMTPLTAEKVADFVLSKKHPGDRISIEWFGGEPLLNYEAIDIISERILTGITKEEKFSSSIITNASRIDEIILHKLKNNWHTDRIQITIDGIGEKYNQVKQLGHQSFDRLMTIIDSLAQTGIIIDIRFNYDQGNFKEIEQFARFFSDYKYKDRLTFYSAKLFSERSKRGYFDLEEESIFVDTIMNKYGLIKGIQLIPRVFNTGCMAMFPHFFTIDPQGRLFKCDRRLLDENTIASVDHSEGVSFAELESLLAFAPKCKLCNLFPLCWGGCQYDRLTGIYPCYLTTRIINEKLLLALNDIILKKESSIMVASTGRRIIKDRIDGIQYPSGYIFGATTVR